MKRKLAISALISLLSLLISPALANTIVQTVPASGSTIKVAPSAVTIFVDITPMDMGNEVTVTDPSGLRVDDGTLTVIGNEIIVGMKPITESGVYLVSYNIISEMDAPLQGSFNFTFSGTTISKPDEVTVSASPVATEGSDFGTNVFVITLLAISLFVLITLALYARKIFKDR